ncbi:MAG: permease-like cell division protein FtsX [Mariprofundaceae bacterium]|nr:permease-like cell division protein FtsX [Mariprofundaceae bacterium]
MQPEKVKIHLPGGWNMPPLGIHQYLALMIVAIALWALGSVWMGLQATGDWVGAWQKNMVLHVYLPQASNDQLTVLKRDLQQVPGVVTVTSVSHDEAADWMQQWLGQGVANAALMAKHLPETLVLSLQADDGGRFVVGDVRETAQRVGASINEDEVRLLGMRDVLNKAAYLAWFVTLLLGLAMSLIVSNTLRMILLARADEVYLMRLMGAKEWFVRMPFLLEGLALGAAAGLLAWGLLWPWVWGIASWLENVSVNLNIWVMLLPLLLGGAVLGCLGAAVATARLESPDSVDV